MEPGAEPGGPSLPLRLRNGLRAASAGARRPRDVTMTIGCALTSRPGHRR